MYYNIHLDPDKNKMASRFVAVYTDEHIFVLNETTVSPNIN
jgi:L-lactate utilization protein LutC